MSEGHSRPPSPKGGPRSIAGKKVSARNAVKHGGNSAGAPRTQRKEVRLAQRKRGDHLSVPMTRHCPFRPCACPEEEVPCPVLTREWDRGFRMLMALRHVRPEQAPAAKLIMDDRITILTMRGYAQRVGIIRVTRGGLDVQPVLRVLWTATGALARGLREFGLTPLSAKELGLDDPIDIGGPSLEELRAKYAGEEPPPVPEAKEGAPDG